MEQSQHYSFNLPSRDTDDAADIDVISRNFEEIDRLLGEVFIEKTDILQVYDPASREPISAIAVAEAISGAAPNIAYDSSIFEGVFSVADELKKLEEDSDSKNDSIAAANVRIDNVEGDLYEKTEWRTLSAGTTDKVGESIKEDFYTDISNFKEFKLYLEFPTTSDMASKTPYISCNISGSLANNCFASTQGAALVADKTYRFLAQTKIVKTIDGYMSMGISSRPDHNSGANTRSAPYTCISPWNIKSGTQYLEILFSSSPKGITFPVGTKWVLEGR